MRAATVAVACVALLSTVIAGPRKVLVLPLDGNAPAAQKSQLDDSIAKLSRDRLDGDVTLGDTTFVETAAAVGCDPASPACAETVRTTLSVDELVFGSAKSADGSTTVTVYRAAAGSMPTSQIVVITEADGGDKAEPALQPLFGGAPIVAGPPVGSAAGPTPEQPGPSRNFFDTRARKVGVGLGAGGVIALVIGLSFWSSKSDLQEQIDTHPTRTLDDLQDLQFLEQRAADKALWGNIMVGAGVGLLAVGAFMLYSDHRGRSAATVTPAPAEVGSGMTLVLRGRW
jgi:hypothetical protein